MSDESTAQAQSPTMDPEISQYLSKKFNDSPSPAHTSPQNPTPEIGGGAATTKSPEGTTPNTPNTPTPEGTPQGNAVSTPEPAALSNEDFYKRLDEISGGMFKDETGFKSALPKIQQFSELEAKKTELEQAMAGTIKPASEFVTSLNDLVAKGASKDQINSFIAVNQLGDLSELDARESKIMKMVLVDGMKESVARRKVEKDFPSDLDHLSDEDREDLEEELRLSQKTDLAELSKYKKDLSTVGGSPEETELALTAKKQSYATQLNNVIPGIASGISGLGKVTNGKEGTDEISLEITYPDEFKAQIPERLKEYFLDGMTPVNAETVAEATTLIHADYLVNNFPTLLSNAIKHAESVVMERMVAKYENRGGILQDQFNPNNPLTDDAAFRSFQEKVANGGR